MEGSDQDRRLCDHYRCLCTLTPRCVVLLWVRFPRLTGAGETLDVKVSVLHSHHLSFAYFPASLAPDWSRTSLTARWALVISCRRQKDTRLMFYFCVKLSWMFEKAPLSYCCCACQAFHMQFTVIMAAGYPFKVIFETVGSFWQWQTRKLLISVTF